LAGQSCTPQPGRRSSRLRCPSPPGRATLRGGCSRGPEFPRGVGQNSPVTRDAARYGGAARGSRFAAGFRTQPGRSICPPRDLSNRGWADGLTMHTQGPHRRKRASVSRLHRRRGGGRPVEGDRLRGGCQTAWSVRVTERSEPAMTDPRPPDSGVVPFSEASASPIKSDACASGRVGRRSKAASRLHRPRYYVGEKTTNWRDRAYGIS